ncbi:MAG: Ig-like domain repeat protein [Pseudomonadota bacterium]
MATLFNQHRLSTIIRSVGIGIGFSLALNIGWAQSNPEPQSAALPQLFKAPSDIAKRATKSAPVSPSVSPAAVVQFNSAEMHRLAPASEVELTLPNGKHTIIFERAEQLSGGNANWVGYLKNHGKDYRVLITSGPSGSFGTIKTPDGEFNLSPGDGHDWLVDMNQERKLVPEIDLHDDVAIPPPSDHIKLESKPKYAPFPVKSGAASSISSGTGTELMEKALPAPQVFVDLMIVYTQGFATKLGAGLAARLDALVLAANQSYIDSEVAITLRLVRSVSVNYSDVTEDDDALYAITPGGSSFNATIFGNIESQRAAAGADLVVLLRDGGNSSGHGIAWISHSNPHPNNLYSVTTGCVTGCPLVFIHELGHNMGNAHDRAIAAWQDGGTATPSEGAYSYSFGNMYCVSGALTCNPYLTPGNGGCASNQQPTCSTSNTNNFGTLMSYYNPQRIYKFSNPNVTCTPSGGSAQPCGVANVSDNARSMNNMRTVLSGIKTAPNTVASTTSLSSSLNPSISGQSVQFTATVSGGAGTATGTVAFRDGAATLSGCAAVALVSGSASCSTTVLSVGSHGMTAQYAGNASYSPSTSSSLTQTVNAPPTAPSAPTNVSVTAGAGKATFTFSAPASNGGSTITSYGASCSASGQTTRSATGSTAPITVTGLVGGVSYTCSVTATNSIGTSSASTSVALTPLRPKGMISTLMLLLLN